MEGLLEEIIHFIRQTHVHEVVISVCDFLFGFEPSRLVIYSFSAFRNVWKLLMKQGYLRIFLMCFTQN